MANPFANYSKFSDYFGILLIFITPCINFLIITVPISCDAKDVAFIYEVPNKMVGHGVYRDDERQAISYQIGRAGDLMKDIAADKKFISECDQFSFNIQADTSLRPTKPFRCERGQSCFEQAKDSLNYFYGRFPTNDRQ